MLAKGLARHRAKALDRLQARGFEATEPGLHAFIEKRLELFRTVSHEFIAEFVHDFLQIRRLQRLLHSSNELIEHRLRYSNRRKQAVIGSEIEIRITKLDDRWHVGNKRGPLRLHDGRNT